MSVDVSDMPTSPNASLGSLRVALVHDWLTTYAGSERVLEQLITLFPSADVFTLVDTLDAPARDFLQGRPVRTSFLQHLPGVRRRFRQLLPLLPIAIEQFDLSAYDLVISSSHAVAKGVITGPDQVHVSYVHSPMRYAWDLQHQYLRQARLERGPVSWAVRVALHNLRVWDASSAPRVDTFVANSRFIARRIQKAYGRSSTVVHPPVDVERIPLGTSKGDFYVTASRMVPYKRIDLIVEAFGRLRDRRLLVIGEGPEMSRIRAVGGPNVELLGYQPTPALHRLLGEARGFVFAAEEDFGILPVEAQAAGTPVIGLGRGGLRDTVLDAEASATPTGIFFESQTVEDVVDAVRRFESHEGRFDPHVLRAHAQRFSVDAFRTAMIDVVTAAIEDHAAGRTD